MKKLLVTYFSILTCFLAFGQNFSQLSFDDLMPISQGEIVKHTYYTLSYSEDNEQPYWVFYRLTPDFLNSTIDRTDDFRPDPFVSTGSASLADYAGSGYDRGHLAPAADMKFNETSISESFYLSNMSPQNASFNRGIWSKLEELVRSWCPLEDTLYIATGPIFKDNLGVIGANDVTVPGYFYKAILDITGEKKMIAFVLPNAKSSAGLETFVITIDSLEILTGIDFFPGLSDDIETTLESKTMNAKWNLPSTTGQIIFSNKYDGIKIFPNPASDKINVIADGEGVLNIYGINGNCIFKTDLTNGINSIDVNSLPKGVYSIQITEVDQLSRYKIIKE